VVEPGPMLSSFELGVAMIVGPFDGKNTKVTINMKTKAPIKIHPNSSTAFEGI